MDFNLIENIVFAILFAYFIIRVFKGLACLMQLLFTKLIVYLREKKFKKNVDQEYIDFLKGENNDK